MYTDTAYSNPQPNAWSDLVSHAEAIVPDQSEPQPHFCSSAAEGMVQRVNVLADNPLEANLYYGLGLGMLGLHTQLENPGVKEEVTDSLTEQLERQQLDAQLIFEAPLTRNVISRLRKAAFNTFGPMTYAAMRDLSAPKQLVIEGLAVVTDARRKGQSVVSAPDVVTDAVAEKISQRKTAARLNAVNTIGGPVVIWRKAIEAKRDKCPYYQMKDVRNQDPTRAAARAAGLHSEEFNSELLDRLLVPSKDGELTYDRSHQPLKPCLPAPDNMWNRTRHTDRLKCPALFVGHFALLRNVLDIVWEAGQRADP